MTDASLSLILASGSAARKAMLEQAGVAFFTQPADVDEEALKSSLADQTPEQLARALAEAKALAVSRHQPANWVLGSDQVLDFAGEVLSKARTLGEAELRLKSMRGRSHQLISAACLARDGQVVWTGADRATLWMRDFSDGFLASYLAFEGKAALSSVGTYRLEGPGAQLFDRVDGDYFTILGMPLWPVLAELRRTGVLVS